MFDDEVHVSARGARLEAERATQYLLESYFRR